MLPKKSTMLFPSVYDMCLWAHEPCLGLPTASARSLRISRDLSKPPHNASSDPQPKDDAHGGADPLPWLAGGTNHAAPLPIARVGAIRRKALSERGSRTRLPRESQQAFVSR